MKEEYGEGIAKIASKLCLVITNDGEESLAGFPL